MKVWITHLWRKWREWGDRRLVARAARKATFTILVKAMDQFIATMRLGDQTWTGEGRTVLEAQADAVRAYHREQDHLFEPYE